LKSNATDANGKTDERNATPLKFHIEQMSVTKKKSVSICAICGKKAFVLIRVIPRKIGAAVANSSPATYALIHFK
jgi:hypothetical protein